MKLTLLLVAALFAVAIAFPSHDSSKEDASQDDASQDDASQDDASLEDANQDYASQEDSSLEDTSQYDSSQDDDNQDDGNLDAVSQDDASQDDASPRDASQDDDDQAYFKRYWESIDGSADELTGKTLREMNSMIIRRLNERLANMEQIKKHIEYFEDVKRRL